MSTADHGRHHPRLCRMRRNSAVAWLERPPRKPNPAGSVMPQRTDETGSDPQREPAGKRRGDGPPAAESRRKPYRVGEGDRRVRIRGCVQAGGELRLGLATYRYRGQVDAERRACDPAAGDDGRPADGGRPAGHVVTEAEGTLPDAEPGDRSFGHVPGAVDWPGRRPGGGGGKRQRHRGGLGLDEDCGTSHDEDNEQHHPDQQPPPPAASRARPVQGSPPSSGTTRNTGYRGAIAAKSARVACWLTGMCGRLPGTFRR
jgi:hypothetical protein